MVGEDRTDQSALDSEYSSENGPQTILIEEVSWYELVNVVYGEAHC